MAVTCMTKLLWPYHLVKDKKSKVTPSIRAMGGKDFTLQVEPMPKCENRQVELLYFSLLVWGLISIPWYFLRSWAYQYASTVLSFMLKPCWECLIFRTLNRSLATKCFMSFLLYHKNSCSARRDVLPGTQKEPPAMLLSRTCSGKKKTHMWMS